MYLEVGQDVPNEVWVYQPRSSEVFFIFYYYYYLQTLILVGTCFYIDPTKLTFLSKDRMVGHL